MSKAVLQVYTYNIKVNKYFHVKDGEETKVA